MEEFSHLGGGGGGGDGGGCGSSSNSNSRATASFMYLPSPTPTTPSTQPQAISFYNPNPNLNPNPNPKPISAQPKSEAAGSSLIPYARRLVSADDDAIKAKIVSHPRYSALLGAYMDCQKVGAPPEVAARLSAIAREIEARQQQPATAGCRCDASAGADPELDLFMEAYCNMLVKYREELKRPLQEGMDFLRRVESQLSSLTHGATASILNNTDEKCEGVGSSEDDQDDSGGEAEHPEIDPRADGKELRHHLLKKYSGYLGSLRHELSKKKKKGKLPKEARQKLLNWWELHYKWPYPSESEKVAMAESTGLNQKQINNWFINQRKRHWKPSEEMQFVVMDAFPQQNAAALYMGGQFMGDGSYRLGP